MQPLVYFPSTFETCIWCYIYYCFDSVSKLIRRLILPFISEALTETKVLLYIDWSNIYIVIIVLFQCIIIKYPKKDLYQINPNTSFYSKIINLNGVFFYQGNHYIFFYRTNNYLNSWPYTIYSGTLTNWVLPLRLLRKSL